MRRRSEASHLLSQTENRRGGSSRSITKVLAAVSNIATARAARLPERHAEVSRVGGIVATRPRYRCGDCELVSTAPGLGMHQKIRGHAGRLYLYDAPMPTEEDHS